MPAKFIIGIDLGGTNLKAALLDLECKVFFKKVISTREFHQKENLIRAIVKTVNSCIEENGLRKADCLGIGLGLPGPIDVERGMVHFFPNIPGWKDVRLKGMLEKKLGMRVVLDNDANLMALAEFKLGAAKGLRNCVCVTLGTGVGGGIIIDGRLYRGSSFAAGEVGHIPINEKGPACNCGGKACLESYIGNDKILSSARRSFGKSMTLEILSALANAGNKKAKGIWLAAARRLGICLSGVINILNPDCIVIGGGVANAGKVLFDEVRAQVRQRAMPVQAHTVKIIKAMLGDDAGLIGAGLLAKENLLK